MKRLISLCAVALAACQSAPKDLSSSEDASVEVEYQGDTTNGAIPLPEDVPADTPWEEDAGAWTIERRCCEVVFQIDDQEPEFASGKVVASMDGLRDGVALTRSDAGWSAGYCMPLHSVVAYHYAFSWLADDGGVSEDGGSLVVESARASSSELHGSDGQGGEANYYVVDDDCGAADASVRLSP